MGRPSIKDTKTSEASREQRVKSKRFGTLYEQVFIVEALRRDLQPHMPVGDYLAHDVVVYTNEGVCSRVQIKGTACASSGMKRQARYQISNKSGAAKRQMRFDCSRVDVVAVYVAPFEAWYLIPCEEVVSKTVRLYPHIEDSNGQYEKYRDNWEVFN
jgi:hypothetical protein